MIARAERGECNGIVVLRLDRFARPSVKAKFKMSAFYNLVERLAEADVAFISLTEGFDTSTPTGRLMLGFLATVAGYEREITGQRIREGNIYRAKNGIWPGGRIPMGYLYDDQAKRFTVDRDRAKDVVTAFEVFCRHRSYQRTARELNKAGIPGPSGGAWDHRTVQRIVSNRFYSGRWSYGTLKFEGNHPVFVPPELADRALAIASDIKAPPQNMDNAPNVLSGLIYCGLCGSRMHHTSSTNSNGKLRYYRCQTYKLHGKGACSMTIKSDTVVVRSVLRALVLSQGNMDDAAISIEADTGQLESLRKMQKEITDAFFDPVFLTQKEQLRQKLSDINAQISVLESPRINIYTQAEMQQAMDDLETRWPLYSPDLQRDIVTSFIGGIRLYADSLEITTVDGVKHTQKYLYDDVIFREQWQDKFTDRNDLRKALFALPEIYREPLSMLMLDGLEYSEICQRLNISPAALRTRLKRARQRLK